MPQKLHPEWDGFDRLLELDENKEVIPGVPAKARCKKCLQTFSKTGQDFMKSHKENCGKPKTTSRKKKGGKKKAALQCRDFDATHNSDEGSAPEHSNRGNLSDLSLDNMSQNSNLSPLRSSTPTESTTDSTSNEEERAVLTERRRLLSTSSLDLSRDDSRLVDSLSRSSSIIQPALRASANKSISKRKRPDFNKNEDSVSDDTKALSIYKYILCEDLDFTTIESKSFMDLLQTFDTNFQIPSARELRTAVGLKAADEVFQKNQSKQHNGIIQIVVQVVEGSRIEEVLFSRANVGEPSDELTENATRNVILRHEPDTVMVMALLGDRQNQWTYVKHKKFEHEHATDFSNEIETFCDQSVLESKKEYGVTVYFVLHDGTCNLKFAKEIELEDGSIITYYNICQILPLLSKVKCKLITEFSNHREVAHFYDEIQYAIPQAVKKKNITMSQAIQRLFECTRNLDKANQTIVCAELVEIVSPLHLAAKIFHPAHHGDILNEKVFKPLYKRFCDFQIFNGPDLIANIIPYYLEKSAACFKMLYNKNRETHPIRFWEISKLDKSIENMELLAEWAINLIQIPAKVKHIDLAKMFERRSKHKIAMSDFDQVFFSYMLESSS